MGIYFNENDTLEDKKKSANKSVGSKTKTIRKSMNLTQREFSEKYGIKGGCATISKIEHSKRSISADLLPILAEDGNITVEQFFREDISIVQNVFYNCLSRMNLKPNQIGPILCYVDKLSKDAIENIGATKLFDLMFTPIYTASHKGNTPGVMTDKIGGIEADEYSNSRSRYINYLKEMAIYNEDTDSN